MFIFCSRGRHASSGRGILKVTVVTRHAIGKVDIPSFYPLSIGKKIQKHTHECGRPDSRSCLSLGYGRIAPRSGHCGSGSSDSDPFDSSALAEAEQIEATAAKIEQAAAGSTGGDVDQAAVAAHLEATDSSSAVPPPLTQLIGLPKLLCPEPMTPTSSWLAQQLPEAGSASQVRFPSFLVACWKGFRIMQHACKKVKIGRKLCN